MWTMKSSLHVERGNVLFLDIFLFAYILGGNKNKEKYCAKTNLYHIRRYKIKIKSLDS